MGRTGESVRRITDSGYSPAWSPDGTRLVFETAPLDPFNRTPSELWTVTLATGEKRRLSDVVDDQITTNMFVFDPRKRWSEQTPQVLSLVMETGLEFSPYSWSPDGKQLLGAAGSEGKDGIFTYAFASKRFTRLTDVGREWTWLNDGRRLLFTDRGRLLILDSVSKSSRELLSVAPDDFDSVTLSPDTAARSTSRAPYGRATSG